MNVQLLYERWPRQPHSTVIASSARSRLGDISNVITRGASQLRSCDMLPLSLPQLDHKAPLIGPYRTIDILPHARLAQLIEPASLLSHAAFCRPSDYITPPDSQPNFKSHILHGTLSTI